MILAFLFIAIIFLDARPVSACNITITPSSATGTVGSTITFTIDVEKTHRNCIIPIDETEIKLKNMEIVNQTLWQKVSSEVNRKQITVRLTQAGEGTLEVIRECPKGGDDETVKVTITPPSAAATSPPRTPVPSTTLPVTPAPTVIPETPPAETPLPETSWLEAFNYTISQPNIIATFIFSIAGVVFLMRRYRRIRYLALLASLAYLGFTLGGCLCALGALQNVILRVGEIKYRLSSYVLLGIPLVTAFFFGRNFCGWVCPMGAVQHFILKKETSKKMRSFEPGPRLHHILRYGKYLVAVVLVITVIVTGTSVFSSIDPFKALFNLDFALIPTVILIALVVASLVIGFPWCKYACPLGAFLAVFSRYSLFKVKIGAGCTNCKACHTTFCDFQAIKAGKTAPEVKQMECARCGECIARCPAKAINFTMR